MRILAALLMAASLWLALPAPAARARAAPAAPLPAVPLGRVVLVELTGGSQVKGRVVKITATGLLLRRPDGSELEVPWEHVVRVALGQVPDPSRPRSELPAALAADATLRRQLPRRPWNPSSTYVEWVGLRVALGGVFNVSGHSEFVIDDSDTLIVGGFEITLFTLHWRYFYWEILRGVITYPLFGIGTAAGIPIRLTRDGRHELRIGAHLTLSFTTTERVADGFGASGAQVYYLYRMYERFAFHIGLQQHSYPLALTAIFGVSL